MPTSTNPAQTPGSLPGSWDVCIVGTGRVGLPLGLSLIESGMNVVGLEIDEDLRAKINAGELPFAEPGYEKLIKTRAFQTTDDPAVVGRCDAIIITVGTPLHNHIETDLSHIIAVLHEIVGELKPGHLICLRSTVAPGTTEFVKKWLEQKISMRVGSELKLVFCPERIAEGFAYKELRELPQIIGAEDNASRQAATALFSRLAPEVLHTNFIGAELIKLFGNIARYINFAVGNQFALVADHYDVSIHELRRLANHRYPRTHIATPGMSAGTCLRKDFGMINEWNPYTDLLLSAWKINEFVPAFLVQHQLKRKEIYNQVITVLGYAFKRDTDDTRDSLSPKLIRYIQRQLPKEIRVSDHNLPEQIPDAGNGVLKNWAADAAVRDSDCVFVATNHSGYDKVLQKLATTNPQAQVVDIWNVGGIEKIFYRAGRLSGKIPPLKQ